MNKLTLRSAYLAKDGITEFMHGQMLYTVDLDTDTD